MGDFTGNVEIELKMRGVTYEIVNTALLIQIFAILEENNMDMVLLEKMPNIAVYSPPNKQPWDDAVTLALTYAEIDYDIIFDDEIHEKLWAQAQVQGAPSWPPLFGAR